MATTWNTTLTADQRYSYTEDGVVHIPSAVDADLLAAIEDLADRQLADPGPWVTDTGPEPAAGRLFTTRYLWRTEQAMRRFVFESGMAELAAALMGHPDLLVLDEPTVGLDPRQLLEFRELLRSLATTKTIVLSSHIMQEMT
jgi:hypothetical protein